MADDHTRYVVHMDILGMSALVEKDAEQAWEVLTGLVHARNHVNNYSLTFLDTAERVQVKERVKCITFSDTILLFSQSDDLTDLRTILVVATEIFNKALSTCIPMRVGISHGTFFFNLEDSMYAGPALIEAYHLGEAAQWVGLVTSEAVYNRARQAAVQSGSADVIVEASVPVEGGKYQGYAVNWPEILGRHPHVKLPISVSEFYGGFEHLFGSFDLLPVKVKAKYINTVEFFNARTRAT